MRRAEWRRRADDPVGPFGWWWRGIVQPDHANALAAIGLPVSLVFTALGLQWAWLLGALACVPCVVAALERKGDEDRLAGLLPIPGPPGQFRTRVSYGDRRLALGQDDMALAVVDGWLYAEGLRSRFSLRPGDVEALITGPYFSARLDLSDGSEIRLLGIDGRTRADLERWWGTRLSNDARRDGEPIFPPEAPHVLEHARWIAWASLGIVALPPVALLRLGSPFAELKPAFMAASLGVVLFAGLRLSRLLTLQIQVKKRRALDGPADLRTGKNARSRRQADGETG